MGILLHSKDEASKVIICFIKKTQVNLQVQRVRTDNGTEFKNKTVAKFFDEDVGKLKAKGDIGVFVGYSKESAAFRIYNKRTRCVPRRREKVIAYTMRQLEILMENDTTHVMDLGDVRTLITEEAHATKYSVRPGTDGQSERIFWTLENMFRVYVRNLVVVGILTFREAEIGEGKMIRLELEQETTKVVVIKERLKEAKDRQES
nr:integrase, catalytic region, zinc finger, CCHC-type, peptidase aspartic, catalytic [Tanacetum cinerariifolium]